MVVIFWISLFGYTYSYLIYPVILALTSARTSHAAGPDSNTPNLTLVIAAYNEEKRIREKLDNSLSLNYPHDRLEIIVASDQSDDGTDDIVRTYSERGVRLCRSSEGKGKETAQKAAIEIAKGDLLVFSDAATIIAPEALQRLVGYFADPRVGAVSSEDRFLAADGQIVGEGLYVRYEMWLRRLESARSGLVGLSGSFFAARAEICQRWDTTVPSDLNTAFECARQGRVAISAPDIFGYYRDISNPSQEYARKHRTILRGMTGLFKNAGLMNPLQHGGFAFQLASHKLARWLVPAFMPLLLLASIAKAGDHWLYGMTLGLQTVFYSCALIGRWRPASLQSTVIRIPFYFMQANLAIAVAWLDYLSGRRITRWTPSNR